MDSRQEEDGDRPLVRLVHKWRALAAALVPEKAQIDVSFFVSDKENRLSEWLIFDGGPHKFTIVAGDESALGLLDSTLNAQDETVKKNIILEGGDDHVVTWLWNFF